jgi:hypothetical protein
MQAEKFRATQGPLKERYRKDTKAALLTLKARDTADDSTVTCKVETGRGLAVAGIHPKCGGSGLDPSRLSPSLAAGAGCLMGASASSLPAAVTAYLDCFASDLPARFVVQLEPPGGRRAPCGVQRKDCGVGLRRGSVGPSFYRCSPFHNCSFGYGALLIR